MYEIKKSFNTIHQKMFYWDSPTGYRVAIVKGPNCYLTDEELKEVLLERIEEYNA